MVVRCLEEICCCSYVLFTLVLSGTILVISPTPIPVTLTWVTLLLPPVFPIPLVPTVFRRYTPRASRLGASTNQSQKGFMPVGGLSTDKNILLES